MSDNEPFGRFEWRAVKNAKKTAESGRPVYDQQEYVRIVQPQNKNFEYFGPATEDHKNRFREAYAHFKSLGEKPSDGAPLETIPIFDAAQVATLKDLGIKTLEAFAGKSADDIARALPEFVDLHKRAMGYLEAAESKGALAGKYAKVVEELAAVNHDLDICKAALAEANDEVKALKALIEGKKTKAA